MSARSIFRPLFAIVCLGATALGLNNTYGDNTAVREVAAKAACEAGACSLKTLREDRSAFKQSFGYQTTLIEKSPTGRTATVDVECQREYFLVGEYRCAVSSGGLAPEKK